MMRTVKIKAGIGRLAVGGLLLALLPWFEGGREPVGLVLVAGGLSLAALLLWRQPEAGQLGVRGVSLPAWLLLGLAALSLMWSINRFDSWRWILLFGAVIVAFRCAYAIAETPWRSYLLRGYTFIALAFALYGVGVFMLGDYPRLTSSIGWANPAAAFLLPALLLSAQLPEGGWRRSWRPFLLGLVLWCAFWLADSRGAVLAVVLAALALMLYARPGRRYVLSMLLLGVSGYALSLGLISAWHQVPGRTGVFAPGSRFAEVARGESTSGGDRLRYLSSAVQMGSDRPLIGFGAGTYGAVHPYYQERVASASGSAHNVYLQTFAELGVPGFALMGWLMLAVLAGLRRRVKGDTEAAVVAAGALALLVHFGLDIDARYPALVVLLGMLLGLSYCPPRVFGPTRMAGAVPLLSAALLMVAGLMNIGSLWAAGGLAAQHNDSPAEAVGLLARASSLPVADPDWLNAAGINALLLAVGGEGNKNELTRRAAAFAEEARRRDPYDAQHHQLLGRILLAKGDLEGAQREFSEALRLDPYNRPEYALDLVRALAQTGKPQAAEPVARTMLERYPPDVIEARLSDPVVLRPLVFLRLELARIEEAQGRAREADKLRTEARQLYAQLQ